MNLTGLTAVAPAQAAYDKRGEDLVIELRKRSTVFVEDFRWHQELVSTKWTAQLD
jgi:hypothetical protein